MDADADTRAPEHDADAARLSLASAIHAVLRASLVPLRTIDVVRALAALADGPVRADKSAVNKAMYAAPTLFEKIGDGAAPLWRARAQPSSFAAQTAGLTPFAVDRVGVFFVDPAVTDLDLDALLVILSVFTTVRAPAILRHHPTADGRRIANLAAKAGLATAEKE